MLERFDKIPGHWITDVHIYSMKELGQLKKQELIPQLRSLVNDSVVHVSQCQVRSKTDKLCSLDVTFSRGARNEERLEETSTRDK